MSFHYIKRLVAFVSHFHQVDAEPNHNLYIHSHKFRRASKRLEDLPYLCLITIYCLITVQLTLAQLK